MFSQAIIQRSAAEETWTVFGSLLQWRERGTLLDIGCGPGDVTVDLILPQMPANYEAVVGLDKSEKMIALAKENYSRRNLNFVVGDICDETFLKYYGYFDHVTSFNCLQWVRDESKAFSNINKLLKSGGDMLILMITHSPIIDIYKELHKVPKWQKYQPKPFSSYQDIQDPVAKVKNHLHGNFIGSYEIHFHTSTFTFNNVGDYRAFVTGMNRFIENMGPSNERDEYIEDMIQHTIKMGHFSDGTVVFPYKSLIIHGVKE